MDIQTAREFVDAIFRNGGELGRMIPVLKEHCSQEEYKAYVKGIAYCIDEASTRLMNAIFAEHPALEAELDATFRSRTAEAEVPRSGETPMATRALTLTQAGSVRDVEVRIFAPRKAPASGWGCRFEIDRPDGPFAMTARGADAVQALEICLKLIGVQLYTSRYHAAGELRLGKQTGGYGFPLPTEMRDLLIGDDAANL